MKSRRVYLDKDLELFVVEFKNHIHVLVLNHWDWSIENYQILRKETTYVPSWSHKNFFEGN